MSALPDFDAVWKPLGEILIGRGLISDRELEDALGQQKQEGGRLGEILFARGLVSAVDLRDALAEQHGLDLRVESRTPRAGAVVSVDARRGSFPLGRLLVQRGHITEAQLDDALTRQARSGERLGQILITSDLVSTFTLAAALAEQQGLITADHEPSGATTNTPHRRPRSYEVREIEGGRSYRLYACSSFLEATDLAFAVLHEWEPRELHVVCIAGSDDEELCWQYPPAG